jgi:hypothetical protein
LKSWTTSTKRSTNSLVARQRTTTELAMSDRTFRHTTVKERRGILSDNDPAASTIDALLAEVERLQQLLGESK